MSKTSFWNIMLMMKLAVTCGLCAGLKCWKCVGKSCDQNPADNYRATQMTCRQGESCMKVYYRQTENGSHVLESTTRTCSAGRCVESSSQDFSNCLQTTRRYNVLGCSLRTCCEDSDLCNLTHKLSPSVYTTLWMSVVSTILCRTTMHFK